MDCTILTALNNKKYKGYFAHSDHNFVFALHLGTSIPDLVYYTLNTLGVAEEVVLLGVGKMAAVVGAMVGVEVGGHLGGSLEVC